MTPRKYLIISALTKQMEKVKEQVAEEVSKFDIQYPHMVVCDSVWERSGNYGRSSELVGYKQVAEIPGDIAKEVLDFCKELQTMKADEIYSAVIKKLLKEVENEDKGNDKK